MRLALEGYRSVFGIAGPLIFVSGIREAGYSELVRIETPYGLRSGQILQIQDDICVIQVFDGTMGLNTGETTVWLERDVVKMPVGLSLVGQVLNGRGRSIDGTPLSFIDKDLPITGMPINPVRRTSPNAYVETGISSIDMMNTLVRGQKLPIFSGSGLPANEIAAQIVQQAAVPGRETDFLVIFAAMGITRREARYFIDTFESTGAINNGIFFMNLASDSAVERLLTPRMALTAAEYFAFEKGYDVLVIMTDMLYYCESLREISAAREEVPGRRGYPGYMYSDLAEIYERAGCVENCQGSITQIPIITMPDDDMTHPVVDLSGYITEGQIVLDRGIHDRGAYPPINVLPSLSRLMNKGIGKGKTFDYHRALADQLYASYARALELSRLRLIVGDDGLTETEHLYIKFGENFERNFVNQRHIHRTIAESINVAWQCLSELPVRELYRLPEHYITEKLGRHE
ncbi:MAG: V-type ATP synthase subunit B [Aminobacterium colombiense]|jgi:V/A-type H+-transporting ATPase subunit B|uniref:V-type ATP synthase subunit B n=1 Tax=Aminobacterium colombiense TaxID=81468 RepID=UPI00169C3D31|nr:V-type ATP synthase subunit B [Aminobacterium colombiense]MDD3768276.1 V-type ATP synthase subunit B [Aminobacterium colombiense]MDD4585103.1 V-type ATP synthase subunit B [Aminobacterium colombiense]NLK29674.1 V-type ATP synthase subunit B [Aminobacterium colombiense]